MANIINFRFKVHDKLNNEIFIIKIVQQILVKDIIPTIKKEMATCYEQISDNIKFYINISKGLTKELK